MYFDELVNDAFSDDFFRDPFDDFRRGIGGFGGRMIGNQHDEFGGFGGGIGSIMNFSSFNTMGGGNQGTVISKSYVSTTNYDKNGNPIKKEYTSQAIDQVNKDGTKISEKQQSYKDSEKGIKKASQQRTLNNVGQKIVKTRDYKNQHEEENHYYNGINEGKFII